MKIELAFEVVWSGNVLYPKSCVLDWFKKDNYKTYGFYKDWNILKAFKNRNNKYGRFTYRLKPVIKWKIN